MVYSNAVYSNALRHASNDGFPVALYAVDTMPQPQPLHGPCSAVPAFSNVLLPRHNWSPAVTISLTLHLLGFILYPLLADCLRLLQEESFDLRTYAVQPLRIHLPYRLYYLPRPARVPTAPQTGAAKGLRPAGRRASIVLPRSIELPRLPELPRINSVVIQPQFRETAALLSRLPSLNVWAPQKDAPAPKTFVMPGHKQPAKVQPVLDAPPKLEIPNAESRLSDLNISNAVSVAHPALPRPPSATTPVRVIEVKAQAEAHTGGIASTEGDPADLITLGPAGLRPNSYLRMPLVTQGAGAGGYGNAADGERATNGSGPGGNGSGSGTGGSGTAGSGSGSGSSAQGGTGAPAIEFASSGGPEPSPPVARIVQPRDGHYAFFVTGSSSDDSLSEAAGLLSGKVVYTVYLRIGVARDWMLQYCLPKSAPAPGVRGTAIALEAPYPVLMLRPNVSFESDSERLFIYGMIDNQGKFEQLKVVGEAVVANKELLLGSLQKWEFRPASRNGRPTAVEILLIIPRQEE